MTEEVRTEAFLEYKEYIQREFQYITKDNILFWNLWNNPIRLMC